MRIFKISLLLLLGMIVFILAWYSLTRIIGKNTPLSKYIYKDIVAEKINASKHALKVVSYNIAHGRGGKLGETNWKHDNVKDLLAHLDKISEQVMNEDPDIVIFNEIDFSSAWSFNVNQAKYIGEKCGYPYIMEQKNMDVRFPFYRFSFGNAILSKYPIQNEKFIDLPPYSKIEDIFLGNHDAFYCELKLPSGSIRIIGIHLEYRSEEIRVECARMMAELSKKIDYPVLVIGDFNSTPWGLQKSERSQNGENAMTFLFSKQGFTSYLNIHNDKSDYTFPSMKPDRLIDWIIGKGTGSFSNSKIVHSSLSDHLMIVSEVELNASR